MNNNLSIGEAFGFTFKEDKWINKVFVGGLVLLASILLIPAPFLAWYQFALFKNVLSGTKPVLPEWKFNTENYITGLKVIAIAFGYSIPSLILGAFGDGIASMLQTLYSVLMLVILPFALGKFVESGKLESAFDIKSIWKKVSSNVGVLVVYVIGVFLAGLVALVGLLGLVVAVIFTAFWSNLVQTYLMAKVYSVSKKG